MCDHRNLVYLGSQKTEGGYNQYLKCLDCGAVLIRLPTGKTYQVGGIKSEEKVSASAQLKA
ncbi:hypothetical protein DRO64_04170 [Candidatus Bathyarchaeota archaeon]|nr:MAG: hypothetical protein DRO64_04170 [Candidatus Bathyarchaeota archaeon]